MQERDEFFRRRQNLPDKLKPTQNVEKLEEGTRKYSKVHEFPDEIGGATARDDGPGANDGASAFREFRHR